jgi:hypothetical protein
VRFTAQASGGVGPYYYQWAIHDGVSWQYPGTWTNSPSIDIRLSRAAATYQVIAYAMSASVGQSGGPDVAATREVARAVTFTTR